MRTAVASFVAALVFPCPAHACDVAPEAPRRAKDVYVFAPGLVIGAVIAAESSFVLGARASFFDHGSFTRGAWAQTLSVNIPQVSDSTYAASVGLTAGTAHARTVDGCGGPFLVAPGGLFDLGFGWRGGSWFRDPSAGPLVSAAAWSAVYLRVIVQMPLFGASEPKRSQGWQTFILGGFDVPLVVGSRTE